MLSLNHVFEASGTAGVGENMRFCGNRRRIAEIRADALGGAVPVRENSNPKIVTAQIPQVSYN